MSVDFDLAPQAAQASPAAPAAPRTPGSTATRTVPVPVPEGSPTGELKAFLAFGGPAVALIAGCYLLWAYGPWLLLGALLLAAITAAAAVRSAVRNRASRRPGASRPTRAGPAPGRRRGVRNLFGGGGAGGTHRAGGGGGGGARPRTVPRPGPSGTGSARGVQRRSLLGLAGGTSSPSSRVPGSRGGQGKTAAKAPGKAGGGLFGARTTAGGRSTPASGTRGPSKPGARNSNGGGGSRTGAGAGLVRRTLGKTMPGGHTTLGKHTAAKKKAEKAARDAAATPKKNVTSQVKDRLTKKKTPRVTAGGKTSSGRRKVPVSPAAAKVIARRAALTRATAKKTKLARPGSKAARRLTRTARRLATHRTIRTARTRALANTRRAARAGNRLLSPLLIRGFLATGKGLGKAHRRMLRIADAGAGPAWAPRLARGVARGIEQAMNAGMWVAKRRRVQKWMLLHYAAAGIGTPSALVRARAAAKAKTAPAPGTGHTAKPGPSIRITPPDRPTLTTRGVTVSTAAEEIADMFDQMLTSFEPASPLELSKHLEQFGPMLERFAAATSAHAQRLQDEYEIKGPVVDMIDQFGQAFGGMHDIATEVVESWRSLHAEDLTRHEEPRAGEQTFWNYQGGE